MSEHRDREARRRHVMRGRAIAAALSVSGAVALTVAIATGDGGAATADDGSPNGSSNVSTARTQQGATDDTSSAQPFTNDDSTSGGSTGVPFSRSTPHTSTGGS